jgi:hypothetical protein
MRSGGAGNPWRVPSTLADVKERPYGVRQRGAAAIVAAANPNQSQDGEPQDPWRA